MRRRKSKVPNDSESFGKVGQEKPRVQAGQLAPLQPSYDFDANKAGTTDEQARSSDEPSSERRTAKDASGSQQSAVKDDESPKRARRSRRGGRRRNRKSDAPPAEQAPASAVSAEAADESFGTAEDDEVPESEYGAREPEDGTDDFVNAFAESTGKMETETQPDLPSIPPEAPDPLAPQVTPHSRQPRGMVVLAIGLPGSGKTTWFKRRGVTPLSSDLLRNLLFDDITEQRYQGLVFSTLRSLLRARLIAKMPWNYVDATNLSPHERRQWIKMARSFGYDVHAVFFNVPIEVCLARNARRERQVSEDVIRRMADRLRPPSFKEGFSKIIVVKVKDAQKAIEQAQHPPHLTIPPDAFEM
jgi:predicted kinase